MRATGDATSTNGGGGPGRLLVFAQAVVASNRWGFVLLGVCAVGLVSLLVAVLRSADRPNEPSELAARRALDSAIGAWQARGWTLERKSGGEAVLRRDRQRVVLTVDRDGGVSSAGAPPLEQSGRATR